MEENETMEQTEETPAPAEAREEIKETTEPRRLAEREGRGERPAKRGFKKPNFKKVCLYCVEKTPIDYKDVAKLRKFVAEGGKILPRRMTGACAKHQREIAIAIKRARVAALLPFRAD